MENLTAFSDPDSYQSLSFSLFSKTLFIAVSESLNKNVYPHKIQRNYILSIAQSLILDHYIISYVNVI